MDTRENWSEAVKRLKPRLLQRLADGLRMDTCLVFVRTNFDADNLEKFLNSLSAPPAPFPAGLPMVIALQVFSRLDVPAAPGSFLSGEQYLRSQNMKAPTA